MPRPEATQHTVLSAGAQRAPLPTDPPALERDVVREGVRARLFPSLAAPRTIGRYRLLGRLGEGGMGLVLSAHDPELDRQVAIKILRPSPQWPEDAAADARLLREARAIARLNHPNVVTVFDVGVEAGRLFVVMEQVRGRSLHEWLRTPRGAGEVLGVLVQAGRGLAAAHAAGLVHRDFKPGNVLLGEDGRVRVADFGLARFAEQGFEPGAPPDGVQAAELVSHSGRVLGTPAYMAPEQCLGGAADERSDQFAFCVCLYEGLFGQRPFRGEHFAELKRAIVHQPLQLPVGAEGLAPQLRAALLRGLAKSPEQRFASMDELLEQLVPFAQEAALALGSAEQSAAVVPGMPRLTAYLEALPAGLNSYPECEAHTALLRLVLGSVGLSERAPAPVRAAAERALSSAWVPEVHVRAVLAALCDEHFGDRDEFERVIGRWLRARVATGFLKFMVPPLHSPRLIPALARSWTSLRRGPRLRVTDVGSEYAELSLECPPNLYDELGAIELLQYLRAALEGCGAGFFEGHVRARSAEQLDLSIRWA